MEDTTHANGGDTPACDDGLEEGVVMGAAAAATTGRKMSRTTREGRANSGVDGDGDGSGGKKSGGGGGGGGVATDGDDYYDHVVVDDDGNDGDKYDDGGGLYRGVIPTRAAIAIAAANRRPLLLPPLPPQPPPPPLTTPGPAELASRPVCELEAAGIEPPPYELAGDLAAPESRDNRSRRGAAGERVGEEGRREE
ncbi:hypothetical protein MYCTH_2300736 [Thermothelomyces thermophilus ATCC 42464]|uniref:Uncharacterized protein n=1 Tax=Thermothelomyces thermophilus (strain ATCC 42464 / BCRC 31852 / DSM 1799) TaxID=573729 RepID=G2Q7Z6_THET4|nr:uncharacterized protein MYCTH_2300736 [Thermothelomyces thermophilus ATCC 42464]AEO56153.1 hypothetical protein MYCTH_2300736 [Thermothelomyces thermophilus ATCC 42464]